VSELPIVQPADQGRPPSLLRTLAIAGIVYFSFLVAIVLLLFGSRYFDFPPSRGLTENDATRLHSIAIDDFPNAYRYQFLGGFLDSAFLYRFDAKPDVINRLITAWDLKPIDKTTDISRLWKQPPLWWAPVSVSQCDVLLSPGFQFDTRGADGDHQLMIHDKQAEVVYIWFKANF
jgi:hypothetical protein